MARFDVFAFNGIYVMDLQNDYVIIPGSRVVAPLLPQSEIPAPTRGLHPEILLDDAPYLLATHLLAAIPVAGLAPTEVTLSFDPDAITRALDILFQGY